MVDTILDATITRSYSYNVAQQLRLPVTSSDWRPVASVEVEQPTTGDTWTFGGSITVDVDTGCEGEIRMRAGDNNVTTVPLAVTGYSSPIVLGWPALSWIKGTTQRVFIEARRTTGNGTGGVRIGKATVVLMVNPPAIWDGGSVNPSANQSVVFRRQQTLATPGTPAHVLTKLGYTSSTDIVRADLDAILDAWCASVGGTIRNAANEAAWDAATAAALPGDIVRATAAFSVSKLEARGDLYGIAGTTLTASPSGGTSSLPIIFTCADGVSISGTNMNGFNPVLDLANCRHVWAVGFNVGGTSTFGIRTQNWGGSSGAPAYIAYCNVYQIRDASIALQGWFQTIAASGGTPPSGSENTYGFSEYAVVEENLVVDPNPDDNPGNGGEGIYLGRGAAPGWVGYAKDVWVRGNWVERFKGNGYEAKPGCYRVRFTDNVAWQGRAQNGAAFELCYQSSTIDQRPAFWDDIEGTGSSDIEIYCEGNRVWDYNITETGASRNEAIIIGMAGCRVANNLVWSIRDNAGNFGPSDNASGILIQSELTQASFGDPLTVPTWAVNNLFWCKGVNNLGASNGSIDDVELRNNVVPTGYSNGTHTAAASNFIDTVPAVGSLDDAKWGTFRPGSAWDLDPGSALIGTGTSISDLDLYIDADIADRPIPASTPNPGAYQPSV